MDERSLFLAALERPSAHDRESWLREACGENAPLRERVAALLAAHDSGSSLLEQSPVSNSMLPTQAINADTSPTVKVVVAPEVSQSAILRGVVQPSTTEGSLGRLGPYEILAILGKGGMGVVLKGHDPKLNRFVAVKVLASHLAENPDSRKRFLREAQAAARVVHPNVVTIFAVDDGEPPYLAMELVEGESLQDKIDREGPFAVDEIQRIASQIAEGLAAAHAQGLVHRDIKPANILIEKGTGRVKITDFGLARAVDDVALTGSGLIVGTPLYMSPEQAQGHAVDHRSDLFSLGSVIYAMATGQSPFQAETTIAVIRRVCDEETLPLHEVNRKLPPWLGQLVGRLIAKDAAERLGSAADVVTICREQTASAFPSTRRAKGRRNESRSRAFQLVGLVGSAAIVGFSLAATLFGWWEPLGVKLGFIALSNEQTGANPDQVKHTTLEIPSPPRAIAPFSAAEAKSLQQQWADHLGVKVEFTNKVGMKFRLIPPGEYTFGMTKEQYEEVLASEPPKWATTHLAQEAQQRRVVIDKPFYLGVYEVTVADFRRFADSEKYVTYVERPGVGGGRTSTDSTPPLSRDPTFHWRSVSTSGQIPVGRLTLVDLQAYLTWLDRQTGCTNTLPTDEQWEFACRAGTSEHWCDRRSPAEAEELGWFHQGGEAYDIHDVGEKLPNAFGLFDMLGNAGERVWSSAGTRRTIERGGSVSVSPWLCRSTSQVSFDDEFDRYSYGFRVAIVGDLTKIREALAPATNPRPLTKKPPAPAVAPFSADEAQMAQLRWAEYVGVKVEFTDSLGMEYVLIPPGEFMMGSTPDQLKEVQENNTQSWSFDAVKSESLQRHEVIDKPFYLAKYEVRVGDFRKFVLDARYQTFVEKDDLGGVYRIENAELLRKPGLHWRTVAKSEDLPVGHLVVKDMWAYCAWLERQTGYQHVLPDEAMWEFACRAGTTKHWCEHSRLEDALDLGWFEDNAKGVLQPVGKKKPNAFGLYDMLGNAGEMTLDKPATGVWKSERGGNVSLPAWLGRSSFRYSAQETHDWHSRGFRVAIVGDLTKIPEAAVGRDANSQSLAKPKLAVAPFSAEEAQDFQQAWAKYLGIPVEFENLAGMKFRLIPPGNYQMGSTEAEVEEVLKFITAVFKPTPSWMVEPIKSEAPPQQVKIAEPFYLGKFEVTRGLFERFVKEAKYQTVDEKSGVGGWSHSVELKSHQKPEYTWRNQDGQPSADHPLRWVAALDIEEFCKWLGKDDHGTYLIPTEAEWEYACRAGTVTPRYSTDTVLTKIAVCNDELKPVGTKPANPFGLYDMLGNLQEVARNRDQTRRLSVRGGSCGKWNAESGCRSASRGFCKGDGYQGSVFDGYRISLVGDLKRVVDATEKLRPAPNDE